METRATDSTAEIIDQTIESTMLKGKSRSGHDHCRGEKAKLMLPHGNEEAETTPSWLLGLQFGVKYEVNNLGHRMKEVGSEKLTLIHLKADVDDRCHPDSAIYIYLVKIHLCAIKCYLERLEQNVTSACPLL